MRATWPRRLALEWTRLRPAPIATTPRIHHPRRRSLASDAPRDPRGRDRRMAPPSRARTTTRAPRAQATPRARVGHGGQALRRGRGAALGVHSPPIRSGEAADRSRVSKSRQVCSCSETGATQPLNSEVGPSLRHRLVHRRYRPRRRHRHCLRRCRRHLRHPCRHRRSDLLHRPRIPPRRYRSRPCPLPPQRAVPPAVPRSRHWGQLRGRSRRPLRRSKHSLHSPSERPLRLAQPPRRRCPLRQRPYRRRKRGPQDPIARDSKRSVARWSRPPRVSRPRCSRSWEPRRRRLHPSTPAPTPTACRRDWRPSRRKA